jgi:hypothetical protein
MVGRELREVQGPFVSKDDFMAALSNGGPKYTTPVGATGSQSVTPALDDQASTIREMHAGGASLNQIQRQVYGYTGGAAFEAVKQALGDTTTTTAGDTGNTGELGTVSPGSSSDPDWCDFCARSPEMASSTTFATCSSCGVAVCSDCAEDGLCPDCTEEGE